MLRHNRCQALLQHKLNLAEFDENVQWRGVVRDCVLGEDKIQSIEILAVYRQRVMREGVTNLVLDVRVLRFER